MSGAHAPLMPSAAARWVVCPLSVSLEAAHPETEDSPHSLEGTAAHWVVQQALGGAMPAEGAQAPNGVAVSQEMIEGAELVLKTVEATLGPKWPQMLVVERPVQIPRVHPTQCWGTPDLYAWAQFPDGRRFLFLFDYKFGRGIIEARENWQLAAYTCGIFSEAGIDGISDQQTVVAACVTQPRAYHREGPVRWWKVRGSDLRGHFNILASQAAKALGENPPAKADPEACKNCRGRAHCEANQRAGYDAADRAEQSSPIDMPPLALGLELRALKRAQKLLDARVSGLEAEVEATIKRGQLVPYWAMESTPGRLAWDKPAAEVLMLGTVYGLDIAAPATPVTPTQAIKAGLPADLVAAYASRPPGAAKLTFDDGTKARLTFTSSDA